MADIEAAVEYAIYKNDGGGNAHDETGRLALAFTSKTNLTII